MVKKFTKNQPYTLCLIKHDHTWSMNVTYNTRIGNVLEFTCSNYKNIVVDLDTTLVAFEYEQTIWASDVFGYVDQDYIYNVITDYTFANITNIVKGWQF